MAILPNNAETKRITVALPKSLVDRLDAEASELALTRPAMITMIIREYYKAQDSKELIDIAQAIINKAVTIQENPDFYRKTEIGNEIENAFKEYKETHD